MVYIQTVLNKPVTVDKLYPAKRFLFVNDGIHRLHDEQRLVKAERSPPFTGMSNKKKQVAPYPVVLPDE